MNDRITYTEAAELLKIPYTTLRAFRKRIGAPEPVVITSGTQPALFSKREYEEFALDHNVKALIAAERYFDKHGVYPNEGDAKPTFNKLAFTFLKGAYLSDSAKVKHQELMAIAKATKPKTVRITLEPEWAIKPTEMSAGRVRPSNKPKADGLPRGVQVTRHGTFRAKIKFNKVEYSLGTYQTVGEAIEARQAAEEQLKATGRLK